MSQDETSLRLKAAAGVRTSCRFCQHWAPNLESPYDTGLDIEDDRHIGECRKSAPQGQSGWAQTPAVAWCDQFVFSMRVARLIASLASVAGIEIKRLERALERLKSGRKAKRRTRR